jgi:hypothetical protein
LGRLLGLKAIFCKSDKCQPSIYIYIYEYTTSTGRIHPNISMLTFLAGCARSVLTATRTPKKCSAVTIMAAPTMWDAEREITYRTIRRREGQWRQDKRDSASIASLAGCLARSSKSLSISKGGNARRAPAGHLAPDFGSSSS